MIYVGIDVSKDKHDCYIVNSDGVVLADVFSVENNLDGFDLLLQRLKSVAPDLRQCSKFSVNARSGARKGFPEPEVSGCEHAPTQPPRQRLGLGRLPGKC